MDTLTTHPAYRSSSHHRLEGIMNHLAQASLPMSASPALLAEKWKRGNFQKLEFPHPDHPEEAHDSRIYSLHLSPSYLVSCGSDTTIRIWSLSTQRLVRPPLLGHSGSVLAVQFDEGADVMISTGIDASIIVWKFSTGEIVKKVENAHEGSILGMCFDAKNGVLVTSGKDKFIKIWDLESLDLKKTLVGHAAAVNSVFLLGNGRVLSGCGDRTVKMWSLETGECLQTFRNHERGVTSVAATRDGGYFVSGSADNTIFVASPGGAGAGERLTGHMGLIRRVWVNESCDKIISGGYDGAVIVWTREEGMWKIQHRLDFLESVEGEEPGRVVCLDADERRIVCGGYPAKIVCWDFGQPC